MKLKVVKYTGQGGHEEYLNRTQTPLSIEAVSLYRKLNCVESCVLMSLAQCSHCPTQTRTNEETEDMNVAH